MAPPKIGKREVTETEFQLAQAAIVEQKCERSSYDRYIPEDEFIRCLDLSGDGLVGPSDGHPLSLRPVEALAKKLGVAEKALFTQVTHVDALKRELQKAAESNPPKPVMLTVSASWRRAGESLRQEYAEVIGRNRNDYHFIWYEGTYLEPVSLSDQQVLQYLSQPLFAVFGAPMTFVIEPSALDPKDPVVSLKNAKELISPWAPHASRLLTIIDPNDPQAGRAILSALLMDPQPEVSSAALDYILRNPKVASNSDLLECIRKNPSPETRALAAEVLFHLTGDENLAAEGLFLGQNSELVSLAIKRLYRTAQAKVLQDSQHLVQLSPAVSQGLRDALSNPQVSGETLFQAIVLLVLSKDYASIPHMIEVLRKRHESSDGQKAAVIGLIELSTTADAKALQQMMDALQDALEDPMTASESKPPIQEVLANVSKLQESRDFQKTLEDLFKYLP